MSKETIQLVLSECYKEQGDLMAIKNILEKKRFVVDTATDEEKRKIFAYLLRKGFRYGDISQVIQVSFWNA